MPDGRFVSRSISTSEQLGDVSLEADFLFGRCIPHLDVDGRITGNPKGLKAIVCPLRDELSHQKITHLLNELDDAGLVVWYEVNGSRFLEFPTFARHQKGMKRDREAVSKIPSSKVKAAQSVTKLRDDAKNVVRTNSGVNPDLLTTKESKGKESEVKDRKEKIVAGANGKVSWVVEGSDWWAKNVGTIEPPRFGKALKAAVDLHGWPKIFAAMKCYAEEAKSRGKPAKLEWLAAEIVRWVEWSSMPATDENGDLTPRGRAVLGLSV